MSKSTKATAWTESRLNKLIADGVEEGPELEYKAAPALDKNAKDEITKDVSAFANSNGGILIYGVAESRDKARQHLPERIDPVNRIAFPKEWLEQVMGMIRPRLSALRIHPVKLSSGPSDVAYVVEIPKGETAHQATNLRFYRRYNFEAVPMLEHEIRDIMNRGKSPKLSVVIEPSVKFLAPRVGFVFTAWLHNDGRAATAYDVTLHSASLSNSFIDLGIWAIKQSNYEAGKWVSKFPINPGERQTIAKWQIGEATCPHETWDSLSRGHAYDPRLHTVDFQHDLWLINLTVLAKDQLPMHFVCEYSKAEITKLVRKEFYPID